MVKSFQFSRTPNILFGPGKISQISTLAKYYGNDILLVTGKDSLQHSKTGEFLFHSFDISGIHYHKVVINTEPTVEMIDQAVVLNKKHKINVVIAIGGGSVMDAGKAISAMLYNENSVLDYLEGVGTKTHPGTKIPFIAIPTTAGTGSEATKNAVISKVGENGFKRSLRHDNFVPDYAVIDPELTLNCPPNVTAYSGMDCFTQLVESYLSVKAFDLSDALALDGLKYIKSALVRAYRMGQDVEARSGMAYAALISGITLANANLGVVHGFASSIGARFNIPHGVVCGTLMGISNRIAVRNLKKENQTSQAFEKYVQLGRLFTETAHKTPDWYVDAFLEILDEWTELFALPKLSAYGIKESDLSKIVAVTDVKMTPVKLTGDDLYEIIRTRL